LVSLHLSSKVLSIPLFDLVAVETDPLNFLLQLEDEVEEGAPPLDQLLVSTTLLQQKINKTYLGRGFMVHCLMTDFGERSITTNCTTS
ncbi:hypothetical protein C0J52_16191, partial [Blattella germanica]